MGCCGGDDAEGKKRNDAIEKQIKDDKVKQSTEVKLLLLGAGDSGKSTILKQMKLIHDTGFSKEERESYKEIIFSNTIQSMKAIVEAMDKLQIQYGTEQKDNIKIINDAPAQIETTHFPEELVAPIKALWADNGVQQCHARSREYQQNDSAKYYFENIDRIASKDYIPNDQDVLRSRVKTTGITEAMFKVGELTYRMFDVGGQRSERKKWIHCFENVTAIIFVVAISAYDQVLVEDENVNRMQEALTLFDSICNSKWFVKTSVILFLNKMDIFQEKITTSPIEKYFQDYQGGTEVEKGKLFFAQKFSALNQSDSKQVYVHYTCATDTAQVKFVMMAVNDIIIQANLRDCGLL